jgi:hypothetical protein
MSIYLQYVDVAMLLPMMSSAMAKALKNSLRIMLYALRFVTPTQ